MASRLIILFLCFHSLANGSPCFAKNSLDFSIIADNSFLAEKFMVFIDDGIETNHVDLKFSKNIFTIKKELVGNYATITIAYLSKDQVYRGLRIIAFANKKSSILFSTANKDDQNRLSNYKLLNGVDETKTKEYSRIKIFCKSEIDSNKLYSEKWHELRSDSLLNIYNISSIKLAEKQLQFLKEVKKMNWYYVWFFNNNIINTLKKTHKKELLEFYYDYIPMDYQKSEIGKFIKEKLESNLYVKEGEKAPRFSAIGQLNDTLSLRKYKGKFVLIDFWASWCLPCIEKIPSIKELRNDFDTSMLEIISISYDTDRVAFDKAIRKYEMNWHHVFNDPRIRNSFGDTPIPAIYLIDPEGTICFSSWENNTTKLYEILKKSRTKSFQLRQ